MGVTPKQGESVDLWGNPCLNSPMPSKIFAKVAYPTKKWKRSDMKEAKEKGYDSYSEAVREAMRLLPDKR